MLTAEASAGLRSQIKCSLGMAVWPDKRGLPLTQARKRTNIEHGRAESPSSRAARAHQADRAADTGDPWGFALRGRRDRSSVAGRWASPGGFARDPRDGRRRG